MPKAYYCCWCYTRSCGGYQSRRPIKTPALIRATVKRTGRNVSSEDVICQRCFRSFSRSQTKVPSVPLCNEVSKDPDFLPPEARCDSNSKELSPKSINLPIASTPKGHRKCVICRKPHNERNRLVVVPNAGITQAFLETGIFINDDSKCCKTHLEDGYLSKAALSLLTTTKNEEQLSRSDICKLLSDLRDTIKSSTYLNFDVPSLLSEEDYSNLTGLKKEQFSELVNELKNLNNNFSRSKRTCLAVFLTKLRTGLPNTILSSIFNLSLNQIQRITPSVREALMENFVPRHLGFQHISHQELCLHHITPIARKLFTSEDNQDQAVLILDGTYIYIQKSHDYEFQRLSYSLHKNRPLVKPMMVVAPDGYIISVLGPYLSDYHNNDASITKHMISQNAEDIQEWLKEDDVVIVDRGFRDAVTFMEENGLQVHMPFYLPRGKKQHSTTEANISRMVTKVRWVVESANGRLKQWRLLDKVVPNKLLPQIGDFVRIVCALCNKFRPCLGSMDPESSEIATKMLEKADMQNTVQTLVEENNLLTRRAVYSAIEASSDQLDNFPVLSLDDMRTITLGIYQIKHAENYSREHLKDGGSYEIMVCHDFPFLLRVKIQSRHSRNILHTLWIKYDFEKEGVDSICGWYCTCKCGARIVGCCAHVSSVLWFLGWKRHQSDEPFASGSGPKRHFLNAAHLEDSDSDTVEE